MIGKKRIKPILWNCPGQTVFILLLWIMRSQMELSTCGLAQIYSWLTGLGCAKLFFRYSLPESRAGNLVLRSSHIRSFCSIQMSDCEGFSQIAQDKWATMSESLRSLKTNERPWANLSGCSWKWANVSDLLRLLKINERFAQNILAKKSKILFFSMFYIRFFILKMSVSLIPSFLVNDASESLRSLTKNEQCERIA